MLSGKWQPFCISLNVLHGWFHLSVPADVQKVPSHQQSQCWHGKLNMTKSNIYNSIKLCLVFFHILDHFRKGSSVALVPVHGFTISVKLFMVGRWAVKMDKYKCGRNCKQYPVWLRLLISCTVIVLYIGKMRLTLYVRNIVRKYIFFLILSLLEPDIIIPHAEKVSTHSSYIANSVTAGGPVTKWARASAGMLLT